MSEFEEGYAFALRNGCAVYGAETGAEYIRDVEKAVSELYARMNAYEHYKRTKAAQDSLKGFIAEEWAAWTANVDAAVKGAPQSGIVEKMHALGSPDVSYDGTLYQLKTCTDPSSTVSKLGKTLRDAYEGRAPSFKDMSFDDWAKAEGFGGKTPKDLLYGDQYGLVPSDKLEACKKVAVERVAKAKARNLSDEVDRWEKVLAKLTDRVRSEGGVEGRPLTNNEALEKAVRVSSNEKLKPSDDGMTTAELIGTGDILAQALKAGATSAAISAALKIAPEIYRALDFLISERRLDEDHLRSIGLATADGAATGFVSGSASAAITSAAARGTFGEALKATALKGGGPAIIGTLVVLVLETCRDSLLVADGRMKLEEMAHDLSRATFTSALALAGTGVAAALTPYAAVPALIGSLVGSAVGSLVFTPLQSCALELCVSRGITLFGAVKQNYEVPPELLREMGVKGAHYSEARANVSKTPEVRLAPPKLKHANVHTINFTLMERGVVGVNKVGYTLR